MWTGGRRNLNDEEVYNVYSSPHVTRIIKALRMIWAEHTARMGKTNSYENLVEKLKGKKPHGRRIRRRERK
jgi:hypothetical protein